MDVDYSPTGREFVAASYDRSVRIFGFNAGHSREVGADSTRVLLGHQCLQQQPAAFVVLLAVRCSHWRAFLL
jgi:hypothetical protein